MQDSLDQAPGTMSQYYQHDEYPVYQQSVPQQASGASQYYALHEQPQTGGAHGYPDVQGYPGAQRDYIPDDQEDRAAAGQTDPYSQNPAYASYQPGADVHGAENPPYYNDSGAVSQKYPDHGSALSVLNSSRTQTSSKSSPSRLTQHSPAKPDYIKKNKEELAKEKRQLSYKKLFATKKELKDRPLLPSKLPAPQKHSESTKPSDTPQSMEDLWAIRAQRLEQEKQRKLSHGKKRTPLKKYPSESKVNSLPESATSIRSGPPVLGGSRPPHYVQPIQQR